METTQFIEHIVGDHEHPGQPPTPDDILRAYIAATQLLESLSLQLSADTSSPTRAALYLSTLEHHSQVIEFDQLRAAKLAQETLLHELPPESLTQVRDIADNPDDYIAGNSVLPADPQTVRTGRLEFKSTPEALQRMLGISFYDARDRLHGARSLLPRNGINGQATAPRFPKLADKIVTGKARVKDVCAAARYLDKLRPTIEAQPNAQDLASRIEEKVAESVADQPPSETKKLIDAIGTRLESINSYPTPAEIREKTGITVTRRTRYFTYLSMCMLNDDAEIFLSHFAQSDNPRTDAGDRQKLAESLTIPGTSSTEQKTRTSSDADSSLPDDPQENDSSRIDARSETFTRSEDTNSHDAQPEKYSESATPSATKEDESSTVAPQWFTADPALALDPTPPNPVDFDFSTTEKDAFNSRSPGCDGLTPPQRHLQTLINIMRTANQLPGVKSNGKFKGIPAGKLIVLIKLEVLMGLVKGAGYTAHGLEISAAKARRMLSNDGIIPLVLGGDGEILDLGRERRQLPDSLKLAVQARDGGCIYPGCTVPPELCEFNHIDQWQKGGHTSVEKIHLGCSNHHHMIDNGELRVVIHNGLPHVVLPKYLDPEQKPRRNNYWQPAEPTLF